MDPDGRYASNIGGLAALDLFSDGRKSCPRKRAVGAKNMPPPKERIKQRQGGLEAGSPKP
jgi:hypothetical protein